MSKVLDYYSKQSCMTDPKIYAKYYEDLPADVESLIKIVQGLLIHPAELELYDVKHSNKQINNEEQLRTIVQMVDYLIRLDSRPLTKKRSPENRLIGICRDYSVLLASFLRYKAVPARVRFGFVNYFDSEVANETHNIVEYYDQEKKRWIAIDVQVDDLQREKHKIQIDTCNLEFQKDFYTAAQVWLLHKQGKINAKDFGYNKKWKGLRTIRSSLLLDLDSMNKRELLPWDFWGQLISKSEQNLSQKDKAVLDTIATYLNTPDEKFDELVTFYHDMEYSKEVGSKLRLLDITDEFVKADLNKLQATAKEMLIEKNINKTIDIDKFWEVNDTKIKELDNIIIKGARQHNLQDVDVVIPKNKLTIVTGVSGSGKSSLAFDTIYAEGRRRYMQSVSSYVRRFMDQIEKPKVKQIFGINPTIAIEQKTVSRNPRSTVGTITDIYDYLRIIYSAIGVRHCPACGRGVEKYTSSQVATILSLLESGTVFKVYYNNDETSYVGRFSVAGKADHDDFRLQLEEKIHYAYEKGNNIVRIVFNTGKEILFTNKNMCPHCNLSIPKITQGDFNFNSLDGACPTCRGLGIKLTVDPDLIITDENLSLLDGASPYYGKIRNKKRTANWMLGEIFAAADELGVDLELPWKDLPEKYKKIVLWGSGDVKLSYAYSMSKSGRKGEVYRAADGAVSSINRAFRNTGSESGRNFCMQFMKKENCNTCEGEKIGLEARYVTVAGIRFPEIAAMSVKEAYDWVQELPTKLTVMELTIVRDILHDLHSRLKFLLDVGLHYLTLDRSAPTLSGGEGQRIRLATQLGSGLSGVLYILDEPSIGLHPNDNQALIQSLLNLRDEGNTVLVVEHDKNIMLAADRIIDVGPGAGRRGGEIIAEGTPKEIIDNHLSLTGKYLSGEKKVITFQNKKRNPRKWIKLYNARKNNLKNVNVSIPLETMTSITGVSGSGKSSLILKTLYPAAVDALYGLGEATSFFDKIEGLQYIDKIISIDQSPIGRNARSNPATYVGLFDLIRKEFAKTKEAVTKKYKEGRFSFNSKAGQCEVCKGLGEKEVEMHFMSDVKVTCPECHGKRYNRKTLEIKLDNKSIADVLDMEVQEALEIFDGYPKINHILKTLKDVGLDYIKLGQSAMTLSGGEAQRIKLVKELCREDTGKTIYLLDEPTTGLHFEDIAKLLRILNNLVGAGNTVILIEHNMDIVLASDWIIDMGPTGGEAGGYIVGVGTPEDIARTKGSITGKYLDSQIN